MPNGNTLNRPVNVLYSLEINDEISIIPRKEEIEILDKPIAARKTGAIKRCKNKDERRASKSNPIINSLFL
ncbi:hypothetical protein WUBG_06274 [Wuchereria bancrofti]|uniref:Uncharacterized protein n=1 Tax=Wuchereria bancrofti TaxID=6293 RepID=J9B6Z7_WUCBA|nr:hypothetical protein WUBG_06274 [Wuchereria bancrofti]VDM09649.1 unnamed protein product [Wuchereria bancrofti]